MTTERHPLPGLGQAERHLNFRGIAPGDQCGRGDMLTLTRSTTDGSVGGFTVQTQRRGDNGPVLCVRVTAPDGRVLNACADLSTSSTNSRGPTSTLFGGYFGLAFRDRRTASQERDALAAVRAGFETGWAQALSGNQARTILAHVQAATALMSAQDRDRWLHHRLWGSAVRAGTLPMAALATLHHAGFTPDTALGYYVEPERAHPLTVSQVRSDAALAGAGWAVTDRRALERAMGLIGVADSVDPRWAALSPEVARAAYRAGVNPREIPALQRQYGTLDTDTLAALAALRGPL